MREHPDLFAAAEWLLSQGPFPVCAEEGREAVAQALYVWFLNVEPLPAPTGVLLPHELDVAAAIRALQDDTERFEGGWRVQSASSWGRAVVGRGADARVLDRAEYAVPTRRGLRAQPGDAVVVSCTWDWTDEDTGFLHQRGGAWPPPGADRLVRIYWNCRPAGTPWVIREITTALGRGRDVSYQWKTPQRAIHNGRSDAIVLYLGPQGFARVERELVAVARALAPFLRSSTPRFSLPLAPGVALSEGPVSGESFGDERCRLLAEAYGAARDACRSSAVALAAEFATAFRAAGLDPARPHLQPGAPRDDDG